MSLCESCQAVGVCRLLSKEYRDGTPDKRYKDALPQTQFDSEFESCGEKQAVRSAIETQSVPGDFDSLAAQHGAPKSKHSPLGTTVHDGGH